MGLPKHTEQGSSSTDHIADDSKLKHGVPLSVRGSSNGDTKLHEPKPAWNDLFVFTTRADISSLGFATVLALAAGAVNPVQSGFLGKAFDQFTSFGAGAISANDFSSRVAEYSLY